MHETGQLQDSPYMNFRAADCDLAAIFSDDELSDAGRCSRHGKHGGAPPTFEVK